WRLRQELSPSPLAKSKVAGDPATELPSEVLTAPRLISPLSTESTQILMHRFDLVVVKFGIMARPTRKEMTALSEPEARRHYRPIFFMRSLVNASKKTSLRNGSFDLVDTGTKKLLVTCNHVWEGFDDEQFKEPVSQPRE